jgi:hypothetical protein
VAVPPGEEVITPCWVGWQPGVNRDKILIRQRRKYLIKTIPKVNFVLEPS